MPKFRFADLPLFAQATSIMTLFMGWVMIEEWIIDRHGLDRYLPLYHVGNLCLYDLTVALALAAVWHTLRKPEAR